MSQTSALSDGTAFDGVHGGCGDLAEKTCVDRVELSGLDALRNDPADSVRRGVSVVLVTEPCGPVSGDVGEERFRRAVKLLRDGQKIGAETC